MDEILGVKNTKSKKKKMKKSKLEKNGDENESEAGVKLLLFAELGDEKRLKKLLKRHKSLDINVTDTFLQSGLHKVTMSFILFSILHTVTMANAALPPWVVVLALVMYNMNADPDGESDHM